jgi:serine kinase of HPr protein (carbohydrate metabolism regulator)
MADGKKQEEINIHASCVAVNGHGVLLLGDSGAGKSDIALMLIDAGAQLVADDRTILFVVKGALHARAPDSIKGLLEIRSVGIVHKPSRVARLRLAVRLGQEDERLPKPRLYRQLGCEVPEIRLDPHIASTPARIRAALAAFVRGGFRDTFHLK